MATLRVERNSACRWTQVRATQGGSMVDPCRLLEKFAEVTIALYILLHCRPFLRLFWGVIERTSWGAEDLGVTAG